MAVSGDKKVFEAWYMGLYGSLAGEVQPTDSSAVRELAKRLDINTFGSAVSRMSDFASLRHRFPFAEVNPCVAVELRIAGTETRANVAILYWHSGDLPTFACVGPVLDSRDGEYREFLTTVEGLTADYGDTLFATKQSETEARLLELIGNGTLEINQRNIGGVPAEKLTALENSRIVILAVVAHVMNLFDVFVAPVEDPGLDGDETLYHFGPAHDELATRLRALFDGIVVFNKTGTGPKWKEWGPHMRRFAGGMNYGSSGRCGRKQELIR